MKSILLSGIIGILCFTVQAQDSELDNLLTEKPTKKEYVRNAFKSTRVINAHSIEMLGTGVLDTRILHRFGLLTGGFKELFGLDQATMRFGFDYGISRNLTVGIGRSTFHKEWDGFVKYRIAHQTTKAYRYFPLSIVWVSGITVTTETISSTFLNKFSNRIGYYHQAIVGRKLNERFSVQLSPTLVHRNLVKLNTDKNDMFTCGIGGRAKVSKRMALILDTYPFLIGGRTGYNKIPLSLGLDIETGGHVFQLHITNTKGMNERAYITETTQDWSKGEIQIGFNLSRVFTIVENKASSW